MLRSANNRSFAFWVQPGIYLIAEGGSSMEITAHMAGSIFLVNVTPGATVEPGDEVIVLESMKMEMPIEAAVGGTVTEVRVQPGDVVQEGDVLVVLEV